MTLRQMSPDITVHHFNIDSSPPSSTRLLGAARQLVDAATGTSSEWHSIIPVSSVSSHRPSEGACYMWRQALPIIDKGLDAVYREPELLDWDAPLEENMETIDLNSLPEFENTDLQDIFLHPKSWFIKRVPESGSPSRHSSSDVEASSVTRPRNRFSSRESLSCPPPAISIFRLIPFPHYHDSLDPARPPPPGIKNIPPFRVAHSLTSSASLTTPFARTAWLVPLRGVPPVEGASPAQLDHILTCELPPGNGTSSRIILWTPAAITQFWTFLLRQRNTNNFGPIALAYIISPPSNYKRRRKTRDGGRRKCKRKEGGVDREKERKLTEKKRRSSIFDEDHRNPAETAVWEYIKIYHDSQYAMKLRSVLDSFRLEFDMDGNRGNTISDPLRYRVLQAARLVLVDETGEAILLA